MMYTLENLFVVTGKGSYADRLEKIAFNALPTQIDSNFVGRQYFQQANQVMITQHYRNFDINHEGTDVCYGLFTGYSCCTSNMHQGWPKFTQNLWYKTPDGGLAAMVYAPSVVRTTVRGREVSFSEETGYPFEESIRFRFLGKGGAVSFPMYLRVPGWCKGATVTVNGESVRVGDSVVVLDRAWANGDVVQLRLPMRLFTRTWHENAVSVERGPIVYALKIGEEVRQVKDTTGYGAFEEVRPATPWNYGLVEVDSAGLGKDFVVEDGKKVGLYPWTLSGAPVVIKAKARRLPDWGIYNESAGPQPESYIYHVQAASQEDIILIPYGCTRLRISEFPVVGK